MRRRAGIIGLMLIGVAGVVGGVAVWRLAADSGAALSSLTYTVTVSPGLTPRLTAADAARITLDYLDRASAQAELGTTVPSAIRAIWAATANEAAGLDGCIPVDKGTGIVWVSKGAGTYLNLDDHPWSSTTPAVDDPEGACTYPAPAGTIVIDDATGQILGVYPDAGGVAPHPSPAVPASGG